MLGGELLSLSANMNPNPLHHETFFAPLKILGKLLTLAVGLILAGTVAAQGPNIQIGTDLPCGMDVSVYLVPAPSSCLYAPPTGPITGTVYANNGFHLTVPVNQKVYEIVVSYQGNQLYKYNCALIYPPGVIENTEPLGATCPSAPGVTQMEIGWDHHVDGPNSWNYSFKIQLAMA